MRAPGAEPAVADALDRDAIVAAVWPPGPRPSSTSSPRSRSGSTHARWPATSSSRTGCAQRAPTTSGGGAGGRRAPAARPELRGLALRARGRAGQGEEDPLDPDPPGEWRRCWTRSSTSSRRSPARRASRGSCCATARSTGPAPRSPPGGSIVEEVMQAALPGRRRWRRRLVLRPHRRRGERHGHRSGARCAGDLQHRGRRARDRRRVAAGARGGGRRRPSRGACRPSWRGSHRVRTGWR